MDAFNTLISLGKKPATAQIGGFRPEDSRRSWFGGHFYIHPEIGWPTDLDGPMLPVLQIYVPEIPGGIAGVGECSLIQIFLNRKELPLDVAKNGNKWRLIEHTSIEDLLLTDTPKDAQWLREFQIKWSESETHDYPCWEEAWDYVDMTDINKDDAARKRYFEQFSRYRQTKIGGYPAYIQCPESMEEFEFIMQIASEEKPRYMIGDNGNMYIYRSKTDDEWYMSWDCY